MIHPAAIVEPGAELGTDVSVGPFSFIEAGAKIGDGCRIGPNVTIFRYAVIGRKVRIHANAVIADEPQDLGFEGLESFARVGDNCWIREGVTIHRGAKAGTFTEVGEGCLLMANSHVAHNARLGSRVIMANGALLAGHVEVGDRAFLSGNCGIHQFTRIGRLALVTGSTVATKDVPPFCITRHCHSNVVGALNVVGMRRAGFTAQERTDIRRAFKVLYCSGLNITQAVAQIETDFPSGPAHEFVDFIRASKRGICRYSGHAGGKEAEE